MNHWNAIKQIDWADRPTQGVIANSDVKFGIETWYNGWNLQSWFVLLPNEIGHELQKATSAKEKPNSSIFRPWRWLWKPEKQ